MPAQAQPIGYSALAERLALEAMPLPVESFLLSRGDRRMVVKDGKRLEFYPKTYAVHDSVRGHLEFALKHEELNFEILAETLAKAGSEEAAEALFILVQETLTTELVAEIQFIRSHGRAKKAAQEIVDMPDRLLTLLIKTCIQNQGKLSKADREDLFCKLTDLEIDQLERCVAEAFHIGKVANREARE